MKITRRILATVASLTIFASALPAHAANVTPQQLSGDAPVSVISGPKDTNGESLRWREKVDGDRVVEMWATSPAMNNREVPLVIIKATEANRPTIYLLNGGDGGEGRANWIMQTDVIDFYKEKNVNVVIPMSGKFSYYTDWVSENAGLGGKQMWETFLTRELPGPIEKELKANGKRAIAGMSMSATSSALLAAHNPGFYDAIGSFSGCYASAKPAPTAYIALTLQRGGATIEQMWGKWGGPQWHHNDVLTQAEGLRNTAIYVSNGSGLAGEWDMPGGPRLRGVDPAIASIAATATTVEGGAIEAATNQCTHDFKKKLDSLQIPAHFNMRNTGTHSWGYWQEDLRHSWPVFEASFNS
ncbi:MAG: alpha/beta hydrolase family protein [Corynebacterium sp.]|uniref:alpha/beta hydrolase n=1 Tax=Corynebacterium sp. TaxID=1720 RepID=UPI0026DD60D3|nr:alpha/beta hydrolase family protein [Corynebacterium sp.]MDO5099735.1 alpha/beta hydrolase family protein [Corynebacterium sp.]